MNRFLLVCLLFGAASLSSAQTPTVFDNPELVEGYQQTITPSELAGHLYFYASDFFEGRETATRGQQLAALYLAAQYQAMGIEARGTLHSDFPNDPAVYLQPFELEREVINHADLSIRVGTQTVASFQYGLEGVDGQNYLVFGNAGEVQTTVLFGGYGIETELYDDYAAMEAVGLSPAGNWLMILDGEPTSDDGTSLITEDGSPSAYSENAFQKLQGAFQRGMPAGILIVSSNDREAISAAAESRMNSMGNLSLPSDADSPTRQIPPIYTISEDLANSILAESQKTIREIRASIDASVTPNVFMVDGVHLASDIDKGSEIVMADNVVAFIEGSDPVLKNEVVVISAHLDHIGMDPSAEGDQINNGADDDGSGTVALLEIAEAFQQAVGNGDGPRRSILFLHVAGEEKGLLGSAYYTDVQPLVALENTVANLNIDMIGRHDPEHPGGGENYVYIIGAELISTDIDEINTRVAAETGIDIELSKRYNSPDDPEQFFRRSDHWNFGKHQIPFIFYFTGTHEDYHQVSDEAWKIDYDHLAKITRLVFGTAWQIANQDARPAVSGAGFN